MKDPAVKLEGHASIFRGKAGGDRVQGIITPRGSELFESYRKRLAKLSRRAVKKISDADTIEYLARGEAETVRYLRGELSR